MIKTIRHHHKLFLSFFIMIIALFGVASLANNNSPEMIFDAKNKNTLPRSFRTTENSSTISTGVSTVGLQNLNIAGSAQFSEQQLRNAIHILKRPIVIVDLRQESHGFINGYAVSWYTVNNWANANMADEQVAQDESQRLAKLRTEKGVTLTIYNNKKRKYLENAKPIILTVNTVESESDLAKQYQLGYQRFYVTDRKPPADDTVDHFISFVKQLPPGTTLYFHCRAGKGRTTTFMTMYDMMRNAKQVSFKDIVARQNQIGGINLARYETDNPYSEQRSQFIQNFYEYCRSNQDNFITTWQEWLKSHPN